MKKFCIGIAQLLCICMLGGCGACVSKEPEIQMEGFESQVGEAEPVKRENAESEVVGRKEEMEHSLAIQKSPLISAENPSEENMADMLQDAASGMLVQVHVGEVVGSGVLWDMTAEKLVIATAGHVISSGGEVWITFADGWTAKVEDCQRTEVDLAFLSVALEEIPEEHFEQYYFVNVRSESEEPLKRGDGVIVMGSATGVAADAYEGKVLEPWIFVEDFGQDMILLQANIKPGMSGGGVFDYEGYFCGIMCGGNEDKDAVAIPVSVINSYYGVREF